MGAALSALLVLPAATAPVAAHPDSGPGSGSRTTLRADDPRPTEGLRIVLDDVTPTVPVIGQPIQLRGRVVNDGDEGRRLRTITATAAWSTLESRQAVDRWLDGSDERISPWELGHALVGPVVAAGSEVPFSLRIPPDVLTGLPGDRAVLPLELQADNEPVAGEEDVTTEDTQEGSASTEEGTDDPAFVSMRTVLAATRPLEVDQPLEVAYVVPLTLPADPALNDPADVVRLSAWSDLLDPGAPVRTWMEHLTVPGVTWMVDPSLLLVPDPEPTLVTTGPTDPPVPNVQSSTADPGATTDQDTGAPEGSSGGAGVTGAPDEDIPTDGPGPSVSPALPTTEPQASVDAAMGELREALRAVPDDRLWWFPADDPDLGALLGLTPGTSTSAAVARAMARTPASDPDLDQLLLRGRDDIAWPLVQGPTSDQVAQLAALWAGRASDRASSEGYAGPTSGAGHPDGLLSALLLPREAVTGDAPTSLGEAAVPLQAPSGVTALSTDTRASALLSASADLADEVGAGAAAQRILADSLAAWAEEPQVERSVVVAPQRDSRSDPELLAELSDGISTAPWLRPRSASSLLDGVGQNPELQLSGGEVDTDALGPLASYASDPGSPLTTRTARVLSVLDQHLTGLSQVLVGTDGPDSWDQTLSGLWSTRWRDAPEVWETTWRRIRADSDAVLAGVRVNPSTINFLSDQGVMRVTLVNTLPVQVEDLHVQLVPSTSILQIIDQPDPVTIGPDSRATVSFTARAITRGHTQVTAELTAPNGTPLGDRTSVEVHVTPTGGWIYLVLGGLAGILVVLGVIRAVRSGPRTAPDDSPTEGRTETSGTTETPGTTQEHP